MGQTGLDEKRRLMRQERILGVVLLVAGLTIAGLSVTQMDTDGTVHAQATPPATDDKPAESKPGGTRPTTPAPEPARPQRHDGSDGTTTGTSPSPPKDPARPPTTGTPLPPAPAEKSAPPVQSK